MNQAELDRAKSALRIALNRPHTETADLAELITEHLNESAKLMLVIAESDVALGEIEAAVTAGVEALRDVTIDDSLPGAQLKANLIDSLSAIVAAIGGVRKALTSTKV